MTTKEEAKQLQRDFSPGGPVFSGDPEKLNWRRAEDDEVLQCCASSSYDLQSGHIYCGKVAEFTAPVGECMSVSLCKRHAWRVNKLAKLMLAEKEDKV